MIRIPTFFLKAMYLSKGKILMLVGNVSQRNLMHTIVSKETDIDLITLRQLRIKKSQLFLLKRDNSIFNILLTISSLKKSSRSIIPVCFF